MVRLLGALFFCAAFSVAFIYVEGTSEFSAEEWSRFLESHRPSAHSKRYVNSWAVEVRGGKEHADEVARRNGFENRGQVSVSLRLYYSKQNTVNLQVSAFSDIYEFVKIGPEKNNIKSDTPYPTSLEAEKRVGLLSNNNDYQVS